MSPYPEEFRRDAVALYRGSGGRRTYAAVAADLGITGETLRTWVRKDTSRSASEPSGGTVPGPVEELARLRAENRRLLKAEKEWQLERDVLSHGDGLHLAPAGELGISGENLGSIGAAGERVGRISCTTQHEPETR